MDTLIKITHHCSPKKSLVYKGLYGFPVLRVSCADPDSFVRDSPTLTKFFYEGREDPNTTIISPPQMAFRWRGDDGPILNAGLVALRFFRGSGPLLLINHDFCDFSGGGGVSGPPVLSPMDRAWVRTLSS